jgi:glycine/D-amino acid oxidase-like deaminating enzyme
MKAQVVIIGAGIAGVSAAYHLSVLHGVEGIVIVDPRPPLTLTSDKSTECYRNWWPNQPMVGLMNRSIDLLEQLSADSADSIGLSRRGYIYATADEHRLAGMIEEAQAISGFGAGEVRIHDSSDSYDRSLGGPLDGVDILRGPEVVQEHHPWLSDATIGVVHARRAGWFSAQQAGAFMLDRAREAGVGLVVDEVTDVSVSSNTITGVALKGGGSIDSPVVVNAAGPFSPSVAAMVDLELPIYSEVHIKVTFRDHLSVIPRDVGMIIWSDKQSIDWSDEEREALAAEGRDDLLGEMPIFCHGRPEGGAESPYFVGLWEYDEDIREPEWPLPEDPLYPEVVMRGLTTMVPGLSPYLDGLPHSTMDGGYYSKTRENRPLVGPAGPDGFHLLCGFSGFGVMISAGAADLVTRHITGAELPDYCESFMLSRYENPDYLAEIEALADSGQL